MAPSAALPIAAQLSDNLTGISERPWRLAASPDDALPIDFEIAPCNRTLYSYAFAITAARQLSDIMTAGSLS